MSIDAILQNYPLQVAAFVAALVGIGMLVIKYFQNIIQSSISINTAVTESKIKSLQDDHEERKALIDGMKAMVDGVRSAHEATTSTSQALITSLDANTKAINNIALIVGANNEIVNGNTAAIGNIADVTRETHTLAKDTNQKVSDILLLLEIVREEEEIANVT